MNFSTRVKKYYESRQIYECLHEDNPAIYLLFGLCNNLAVTGTLEQGKEILEDLKRGILHEFTDYNTDEVTKYENYVRTGKMKHDMRELAKDGETIGNLLYKLFEPVWNLTTSDLNANTDEKTLALIDTIRDIDSATQEADPAIFEANFFKLMNRYEWTETEREYQREKNRHCMTMEWLQEKQEQELQKVLEMDIMRYTDEPSTQFLEKVDYPYHKGYLSCDFKDSLDYKKAYAKFMHYATRKENLLLPDYRTYGKYIALYQHKFRPEQKKALFELIYLLNLIHKDMAELKPELGKYLKVSEDGLLENTEYYGPARSLMTMLNGKWFKQFRANDKFDGKWCEAFSQDFLMSEWKDLIVNEWSHKPRRIGIKAAVVGCLKEAGAIEGSDLSIASAIVEQSDTDANTFARYMGRGRKKPFLEWIIRYVKQPNQ